MIREPCTATEKQKEVLRHDVSEFREYINKQVDYILEDLNSEFLIKKIKSIAFSQNDILPKRRHRPTFEIEYIANTLNNAYKDNYDKNSNMIQLIILYMEYYDIFDDLFDGDVHPGFTNEVMVDREILNIMMINRVSTLEEEAQEYIAAKSTEMIKSFYVEYNNQPDAEIYTELLNYQANMYGGILGLSVLIAGGNNQSVKEAEFFGRCYFKFEQLLLDTQQYLVDDGDPWNAWELMPEGRIKGIIKHNKYRMTKFIQKLNTSDSELLLPLVLTDIDGWIKNQSITSD